MAAALSYLKRSMTEEASRVAAATDFTESQRKDVESIILDQRGIKFELSIISLAHSRRNRIFFCRFRSGNFFSDITQCSFYLYAEYFIQIRIRICIHCQNRSLFLFAEVLNQKSTQCGFSNSTFSCDCNYM